MVCYNGPLTGNAKCVVISISLALSYWVAPPKNKWVLIYATEDSRRHTYAIFTIGRNHETLINTSNTKNFVHLLNERY